MKSPYAFVSAAAVFLLVLNVIFTNLGYKDNWSVPDQNNPVEIRNIAENSPGRYVVTTFQQKVLGYRRVLPIGYVLLRPQRSN